MLMFDHAFFGLSVREATGMDPQQRMMLEVVCDALENSGTPHQNLKGSKTGVFVASFMQDWYDGAKSRGEMFSDRYFASGNWPCMMAGRISYHLDLAGPAVYVDTACSSSLFALHLGLQSIQTRVSDRVIVRDLFFFVFGLVLGLEFDCCMRNVYCATICIVIIVIRVFVLCSLTRDYYVFHYVS